MLFALSFKTCERLSKEAECVGMCTVQNLIEVRPAAKRDPEVPRIQFGSRIDFVRREVEYDLMIEEPDRNSVVVSPAGSAAQVVNVETMCQVQIVSWHGKVENT